jgi:hypothetical protein
VALTSEQARRFGQMGGKARQRTPIAERLAAKLDKSGECWLWTGKSKNANGYGLIAYNGRLQTAHHVAWELASGAPVPTGMRVLHTCDNPGCARNDEPGTYLVGDRALPRYGHLFVGTNADNMQDAIAKGRFFHQRHPEQAVAKAAHARSRRHQP